LLALALAGAVLAAVHYRSQAAALRSAAHAHRSAGPVTLFATTAVLPPAGPLAGEVTAVTASPAGGPPQVVVTARITGGRPHARYELYGGDCGAGAAGRTWAAGTTGTDGSANLNGRAQPVQASHEYFLVLTTPGLYQEHPGPAVHGWFQAARGLSAVHGGIAPCAP
jgi:hypothetical protein